MSVYDLKPRFQSLLRPLSNTLASKGVRANHVTVFAALLSIAVGLTLLCAARQPVLLLLLPLTMLFRMALNAIDGMLAREHNQKSSLGAILNELGDVISDAALYLPFAYLPGFSPWRIVLIVCLSMLTEMVGVIAIQIGASRRYDGPLGKSDRAVLFSILALLIGFGVDLFAYLPFIEYAVLLLLVLTVLKRANQALLEVQP